MYIPNTDAVISTADLSSGIYYINVQLSDGRTLQSKFVKYEMDNHTNFVCFNQC